MAYSAQADVQIAAGGADRLVALADTDGNGAIDAGVVDAAIAEADTLINTFASKRFSVPFSPTPPAIAALSARMAVRILRRNRNTTIAADVELDKIDREWLSQLASRRCAPRCRAAAREGLDRHRRRAAARHHQERLARAHQGVLVISASPRSSIAARRPRADRARCRKPDLRPAWKEARKLAARLTSRRTATRRPGPDGCLARALELEPAYPCSLEAAARARASCSAGSRPRSPRSRIARSRRPALARGVVRRPPEAAARPVTARGFPKRPFLWASQRALKAISEVVAAYIAKISKRVA
jgi:phage gp36-like protein